MIDQASVPSLMGSTVRDDSGDKIGKVGQVYLDDTTGQPEWVTVKTGLFGTKETFVPLAAARVEGDELVVDIPKSKVSDAPKIDEDGHLSEEQETELYTYYGVSQGRFGRQPADQFAGTDQATGYTPDATTDSSYAPAAETGVEGDPAAQQRRLRRYQVTDTVVTDGDTAVEEIDVQEVRDPSGDYATSDQAGTETPAAGTGGNYATTGEDERADVAPPPSANAGTAQPAAAQPGLIDPIAVDETGPARGR